MSLQSLISQADQRREADAKKYANQDYDLCVICHAYGADKRSLFIDCFYYIGELVDEAIDVTGCDVADHKRGWHLRICKSCRGRFLVMLQNWAAGGRARRDKLKDHDGNEEYDHTSSRNIPVRIHGAVVMMTMEEYQEYKRKPAEEDEHMNETLANLVLEGATVQEVTSEAEPLDHLLEVCEQTFNRLPNGDVRDAVRDLCAKIKKAKAADVERCVNEAKAAVGITS